MSHEIFLTKCERYGLLGKSEEWIRSYLGDILIGEQYVEIRTTGSKVVKSSNKKILSGIPQGSVLGPLMLSMYVNDLPNFISSVADIVLYADDWVVIGLSVTIKNEFDRELSHAHPN